MEGGNAFSEIDGSIVKMRGKGDVEEGNMVKNQTPKRVCTRREKIVGLKHGRERSTGGKKPSSSGQKLRSDGKNS